MGCDSFSPPTTDVERADSFRPREEDSFKLSFNEFLLAVLSQSVYRNILNGYGRYRVWHRKKLSGV